MVASTTEKPLCPICQKADQVKKLETAYNEGIERLAPPPLPTKKVAMMPFLSAGMLLVGICIFFIIILVGSESFGQGTSYVEVGLVSLTLIGIVTTLAVSYYAFTRVVHGDEEARKLYPAWDQAMETWGRLRYCGRDKVVFDPASGKTLSDSTLVSLLSVEEQHQLLNSGSSPSLAH
jgi:hypothetical protein